MVSRAELAEIDPELVLADGFDDCIIGVTHIPGGEDVVAYNVQEVIATLRVRDGMAEEEAIEFFEFNVLGAYIGDRTPIFIETFTE